MLGKLFKVLLRTPVLSVRPSVHKPSASGSQRSPLGLRKLLVKEKNTAASYFSRAAMIMGGSTRMGIGRTTLVRAVSKSACLKKKERMKNLVSYLQN